MRKKKPNNREANLERLYGELRVMQHNYENAVKHTAEGSNDNQERWMKRAEFWLNQITSISTTIETIEGNNQRRTMTTGEKVVAASSIVLPIFGTVAQWLPYTERGAALANRMADRAERLIEKQGRKR